MDALVIAGSILVLGIAADMDYRTRQVPDVLAICLWFSAIAFAPTEALLLASVFTILMFINDVHFKVLKKPMLGWGDVLIIPPFFAIVDSAFGPAGVVLGIIMLGAGVISSGIKIKGERGEPLVAWLFVCILFLAVVQIIRNVIWL
jgi:hypothetical protein